MMAQIEAETSVVEERLVENPTLCYLKCLYGKRSNIVLQKTLCSFYSEKDLEYAKIQILSDNESFLQDLKSSVKAKHKQGSLKKVTDAEDLLVIFDELDKKDKMESLPTYVTRSVFRIPSDDPDCEDPQVLQSEIKILRGEVQKFKESIAQSLFSLDQKIDALDMVAPKVPPPTPVTAVEADVPVIENICETQMKKPYGLSDGATGELGMVRGVNMLCFYGYRSPLSNFHASPVLMDNSFFPTAEHAFQYTRASLAGEDIKATRIRNVDTPREAKAIGDSVKIPEGLNGIWSDMLTTAMRNVVSRKFHQNKIAREYLQKTKDIELVEGTRDTFWGCGVSIEDPRVKDSMYWSGRNTLGKILMEVRQNVKTDESLSLPGVSQNPMGWSSSGLPGAVKKDGPWKLSHTLKLKKFSKIQGSKPDTSQLKGVQRVSYMDFYVGQVQETTTNETFQAYLSEIGVEVKFCHQLKSKVTNTTAFRFRCESSLRSKVMDAENWPSHVRVRQWVNIPRQNAPSQKPEPSVHDDEDDDAHDDAQDDEEEEESSDAAKTNY